MVRAAQHIPPNFGFVLTKDDYVRFPREVPTAEGVEIDANHYNIGMRPETVRAIARFLDA